MKQTSYWARINDGWIKDPDVNIQLNALDEKVHTVTGASELNVRKAAGTGNDSIAKLKKGDQVVTAGGLLGKVVKVEDNYVELELGANVKVRAVRSTIADVVQPGGPAAND